jgi:hypothetical protein
MTRGLRALADDGNGQLGGERGDAPNLIGTALLSSTTACEASRLLLREIDGEWLDGLWGTWRDVYRASDLLSLIEGVVLYEKLFFLPASLPDDVGDLDLRNRLLTQGTLAPLPRPDTQTGGRELISALGTVEGLATIFGDEDEIGQPLAFRDFRPTLEHAMTQPDEGSDEAIGMEVAKDAGSFDLAAKELIGHLANTGTGGYGGAMESFRAMYYVFVAEHHGLPYLPSISVESVVRDFPNYFAPPVRQKVYDRLALALRTSVATVASEFNSVPFSCRRSRRSSSTARQCPRRSPPRPSHSETSMAISGLRCASLNMNARLRSR